METEPCALAAAAARAKNRSDPDGAISEEVS
jgi:hypothetical protein